MNTILKAIAGVRDSVDERFALVQEAMTEALDIGQMKETISEEMRDSVREHLKNVIQREIVKPSRKSS